MDQYTSYSHNYLHDCPGLYTLLLDCRYLSAGARLLRRSDPDYGAYGGEGFVRSGIHPRLSPFLLTIGMVVVLGGWDEGGAIDRIGVPSTGFQGREVGDIRV